MGKRKSTYRSNKRRFCGNKYVKMETESTVSAEDSDNDGCSGESVCRGRVFEQSETANTDDQQPNQPTASSSKLQNNTQEAEQDFDFDQELTGFRFVDSELLIQFIQSLLCPNCARPLGENKRLSHVTEHRTSQASKFAFQCQCGHSVSFNTSKRCGKTYEVNRRFPLAIFAIGRNYTQGKKFLGNMNMPPPPQRRSWYQHKKQITKATESVAAASKQQAAQEVSAAQGNAITVSCDGTWQRRGFQSKNGVVTALTVNGRDSKVIDTHVMANHCDSCAKQKKRKTAAEFQEWKEEHDILNCEKNHEGSAGSMEPAGAEVIFRRSEELYGLQYTGLHDDTANYQAGGF